MESSQKAYKNAQVYARGAFCSRYPLTYTVYTDEVFEEALEDIQQRN